MKNTTTSMKNSAKNKIKITTLLFLLFLMGCTAYFNTYYNAEVAFKEGQVVHQKAMDNYPDSIVVTPASDVAAKYDRTIDKANKTIETFPKKKKWHDDALFLMGKAYFYKKEMERAIYRFQQLEREYPESKHIPEALLYTGKAYIEEENLDKAEEVLLAAEKRFPELNRDQQITRLMVTIAVRRNGKSQAIVLLEQMLQTIKSDRVRLDVYLQTAELYLELKQYPKAIILLKSVPRKRDFPVQMYRIDRSLYVCYRELDSLPQALQQIDNMISEKTYTVFIDEMLYFKGALLYRLGDVEAAIKVFRELTAGVDSQSVVSDTSSFKGKALLELARIYQKEKEDYTKSYELLKLAAVSNDTTSKKNAVQRMSAMDRLKKLRDGTEKVDSARGSSGFTIGELFRFELDEPDSAYAEFYRLFSDTNTDSLYVPKAMLQAATIARHDLDNKTLSDSILSAILKKYPSTEFAKTAQDQLGQKVTVSTRLDSAETMYRQAESLIYKEDNVKDAIQLFYDVARLYPELWIAPKSLFAAAWFSGAVLNKNKTSKMLYEKICERYPASIYCTEVAKPRIKAVVDTLAKLDQMRRDNQKNTPKANKVKSVVKTGITELEQKKTSDMQVLEDADSDTLQEVLDTAEHKNSQGTTSPASAVTADSSATYKK